MTSAPPAAHHRSVDGCAEKRHALRMNRKVGGRNDPVQQLDRLEKRFKVAAQALIAQGAEVDDVFRVNALAAQVLTDAERDVGRVLPDEILGFLTRWTPNDAPTLPGCRRRYAVCGKGLPHPSRPSAQTSTDHVRLSLRPRQPTSSAFPAAVTKRLARHRSSAKLHPTQGMLMTWLQETFTPNEAAALAQLPPKTVRKDLEHAVIPALSPPRLPFSALVYFQTIRLSGLSWAVRDRVRLYHLVSDALARSPTPESIEFTSVLTLRLGPVVRELDDKLARFHAWKQSLTSDPAIMAGETVFPNSRLTVRHIGEMLDRGESPAVVLEDYPNLGLQDLEFSRLFVIAYPRVGRPPGDNQAAH